MRQPKLPTTGRRCTQRGSNIVELSLVFMGFLLLTVGAMEGGWAVYINNTVSYLAQDGARWAAVHGASSASPATSDSIKNYLVSEEVGLDRNLMTVTASWNPDKTPGSEVTVAVAYAFTPIGVAFHGAMTFQSQSQMTIVH